MDQQILPVPKFKIGQRVWLATITTEKAQHDCPDCLGSKTWAIKSPAGLETTIPCPRCTRGSHFTNDHNLPSLSYMRAAPHTRCLTIGSITAKTHPFNNDDPVEYMCHETGIGSGNIWREGKLFATQEEAHEVAVLLAAEQQGQFDESPHALQSVAFAELTCDLAAYSLSWESVYHSWDAARDYRDIVDRIEEAGRASEEDVEDLLACKREKPRRAKHPLAAILEAIGNNDFDAARAAYESLPKPKIMPRALENEL